MGIFDTNANTYANGFMGPQNYAYNNPGWQIDPNLMTPSYAAPYRPQYGGSGGYDNISNPGFFTSVGRLTNPFYTPPLYQYPGAAAEPYMDSVAYKPGDAFMAGMQRYVVPGLAMGAAMSTLGPNTGTLAGDIAGTFTGKGVAGSLGRSLGQGVGQGFFKSSGFAGQGGARMFSSIHAFNEASMARSAAYESMRAAQMARTGFGSGMVNMAERAGFKMTTAAQGVSAAYRAGGLSGTAAMLGQGAAAATGAAIGSLVIPYLAADAVATAADKTVFEPYINNRRTAADLRENFKGVSFSDASGNYSRGGRGLGYVESNKIASSITRSGIQDFVFNSEEYTEISNLSAKAGLLDSVKSGDIAKRVKSIAEQVKLIVQISQDPSIENAISELRKLQVGGAGISGGMASDASRAYSSLGMSASAAGTTVSRMMDRVGQQGQMLYQMNGMTPYMGQIAAGNLYAGFASGSRTGLISSAQLARMGGLEGATQSALTGAISAMQTPYATMAMYNEYVAGRGGRGGVGPNQTVTGVVGEFGRAIGSNPLEALGTQMLFGNQMSAGFMHKEGLLGVERNATALLRQIGQQPGAGGKFSASQIAVALRQMGMTPEQIQAFMSSRASETDPASIRQRMKGYESQSFEQIRGYLESEGLINTPMARIRRSIRQAGKDIVEGSFNNIVSPMQNGTAHVVEAIEHGWNSLWYGNTVQTNDSPLVGDIFGKLSDQYEASGYRKMSEEEAARVSSGRLGHGKVSRKAGEDLYTAGYKGFNEDLIGSQQRFDKRRKGNELDRSETFFSSGNKDRISLRDSKELLMSIDKLSRDASNPASKLAQEFMRETDPNKRKKILRSLVKNHSSEFKDGTYDTLFTKSFGKDRNLFNVDQVIDDASSAQTEGIYVAVDKNTGNKFTSGLDKILGKNNFGTLEDLQMIGLVGQIGQEVVKGNVDSGNIDEIIDGNKDLKKLLGDRRGSAAVKYLGDVQSRALNEGRLSMGEAARRMGGVDGQKRSNGEGIHDPVLRKKFLAAKQANNTAEMEKILVQAAYQAGSGKIASTKIQGSFDLFEGSKVAEKLRTGVDAAEAASKAAESSVDYEKTFTDVSKKFDQPINGFSQAVLKFNQAVDRMLSDRRGPSGLPPMPGTSPYPNTARDRSGQ